MLRAEDAVVLNSDTVSQCESVMEEIDQLLSRSEIALRIAERNAISNNKTAIQMESEFTTLHKDIENVLKSINQLESNLISHKPAVDSILFGQENYPDEVSEFSAPSDMSDIDISDG